VLNFNKILMFDFETTSKNPETTQPISLAGVMLDGRRLKICDNGLFYGEMNIIPDSEVDEYGLEPVTKEALNKNGFTIEQIEKFPHARSVWNNFCNWVHYHNFKNNQWDAPILGGFNSGFDITILNNLKDGLHKGKKCLRNKPLSQVKLKKSEPKEIVEHYKLYKEPWGFGPNWLSFPAMSIDVAQIAFIMFENMKEPHRRSLDVIKEWLGFDSINAHHALVDTLWTAEIYVRFQMLMRDVAAEVEWNTQGKAVLPIHNILQEQKII
jgi:DNA polymerase III epsilon subunit-like protein